MAIGAIIAGASTVYQLFTSFKQNKMADELREREPPVKKVSPSARAALNSAMIAASSVALPGEAKIRGDIRESTADTYQKLKESGLSGSNISAGLSKLHARESGLMRDVGIEGAKLQAENRRTAQRLGMETARFEEDAWMFNEGDPSLYDREAADRLQGASMQNLFGALENIGDIAEQEEMMSGKSEEEKEEKRKERKREREKERERRSYIRNEKRKEIIRRNSMLGVPGVGDLGYADEEMFPMNIKQDFYTPY